MTKRQRRNFTPEFKEQVVKAILNNQMTRKQISEDKQISLPLLERWVNDYLAGGKSTNHNPPSLVQVERRRNFATEQELKLKIAELYMQIDKMQKAGLTYSPNRNPQKEV